MLLVYLERKTCLLCVIGLDAPIKRVIFNFCKRKASFNEREEEDDSEKSRLIFI